METNRRGRPSPQAGKKVSQLTEKISVQCTPDQKLALTILARKQNIFPSELIRSWIDERS